MESYVYGLPLARRQPRQNRAKWSIDLIEYEATIGRLATVNRSLEFWKDYMRCTRKVLSLDSH